jgi:hypothetical protein
VSCSRSRAASRLRFISMIVFLAYIEVLGLSPGCRAVAKAARSVVSARPKLTQGMIPVLGLEHAATTAGRAPVGESAYPGWTSVRPDALPPDEKSARVQYQTVS